MSSEIDIGLGPSNVYNTAVPENSVSGASTFVMRKLAPLRIESICPRNYDHLHALASDVNFYQQATSPKFSLVLFSRKTLKHFPV